HGDGQRIEEESRRGRRQRDRMPFYLLDLVILVERVLDGMMIAMLLGLLDEPGAGSSVAAVMA
ncbi:hypothetical protein Pmar_PMAR019686, partial [Perkinsus marinus ATCC 50983]